MYQKEIEGLLKSNDLTPLQKKAAESFLSTGIPNTKVEAYKYTSFNKSLPEALNLSQENFQLSRDSFSKFTLENATHLFFENGNLNLDLSSFSEGVKINELSGDLSEIGNDPFETFTYLNSKKRWSLELKKGEKLSPIVIHYFSHSMEKDFQPNLLEVTVPTHTEVTIFEVFESSEENSSTQLPFTSLNLQAGARVEHIKANLNQMATNQVSTLKATLERDAWFNSITFNVGGGLSRNNIEVKLNESNATANVHGLFTTRANQHCDNFSNIHHAKERTYSSQLYKGILDDESRGAFTGRIVVHRDAQEVDSNQLNKNLLLSKKAKIDTRPQLEVYADDVKCAHGATIGQISEEEVFYLESRGIPKAQAQKMLCHAFANEVLELIENKDISNWLGEVLFERFEKFALEDLSSKLVRK